MLRRWNRALADAGWAAVAWPAEYGGRDASVAEQLAYHEVMAAADAPGPVNVIGVANIAPAILDAGTQEQKDRFLLPMLRGDEIWCQGMSEPDAGSDLASLRTAAVLDGDQFVINGQKTWNSLGHHADWCQLYVRTDPTAPKHAGISCLLVDMRTPGIEARPLRTMTGDSTFSELFFTDVRVPKTALLGPLNQGWKVAMTTLSYERAGVAEFHLSLSARFADLVEEATGRAWSSARSTATTWPSCTAASPACAGRRPASWRTSGGEAVRRQHGKPGQAHVGRDLPGAGRCGPHLLGPADSAANGRRASRGLGDRRSPGARPRSTGISWPSTGWGSPVTEEHPIETGRDA